jgi:hypothetical protein
MNVPGCVLRHAGTSLALIYILDEVDADFNLTVHVLAVSTAACRFKVKLHSSHRAPVANLGLCMTYVM